MSGHRFFSVQDMQLKHLQAQQKHLRFVQKYHTWIMNESRDPRLKQLHQAIAETVNEALEHLDVLIEALLKSSPGPEDHKDPEPGTMNDDRE